MATSEETESTNDPFRLCGTTIEGKYRIASVVGDGGFGVVYRGVHKGFGELIAVKCLKMPQELDEAKREALLEQLRDEGRLLHRLSKATSGIVQALDVGALTTPQGAWVPYLVLEWLEGETLADYLAGRNERGEAPMNLADGIRLLEPAARALAVAHQQKVAHRDVKPPNLFVTEAFGARTLKVLDFGIAKVLTETTAQLEATKQGPSAFTPRYGAPEQFNKQRGPSGPWTDVFALALILVEVVTGKKALDGDDPTQLYIASADPNKRPTLRARGVDAPDAVEAVLTKALHIDPKERYSDAGVFWDALVDAAGLAQPARTSSSSLTATAKEAVAPAATGDARAKTDTPRTPKDHPALGATMPVESLASATPAVVVENKGSARSSSSSSKRGADAMAETPIHARLPPAPPSIRGELTLIPKQAPKKASLPMWPFVIALLAIGGGAVYYAMQGTLEDGSGDGPHKSKASAAPTPRGKATSHGRAAPSSATPVAASASAATSGSASSAPAVPTPDDMIAFAPTTLKLGEGADSRKVTLTHPFFLDKLEVSTKSYLECVAARQCGAADRVSGPDALPPDAPKDHADAADAAPVNSAAASPNAEFVATWSRRCNAARGALDHPINCVDFRSAEAYCKWKGRRLPTEAEWESAARGAELRPFAWGDAAPECGRACYDKNGECLNRSGDVVATCTSGVHPADRTPEGLFDMAGNVAEWVADGFVAPPVGGTDPLGDPGSKLRVVRGGSFLSGPDKLRASAREGMSPSTAHVDVGFRCAMDAAPK